MQAAAVELIIAEVTQVVEQAAAVAVNYLVSLIQEAAAVAENLVHQMVWAIPEEAESSLSETTGGEKHELCTC